MINPLLQLSRQQLAQLGREYMIAAQINSRVGYAKVRIDQGDDAYLAVAIPNWMAASPVYTRRMQRAMGFGNAGSVEDIFKGLQLECGFSHQYFDVRYELLPGGEGKFWLDSCGALLEAEPRGDDAVKTMCHDIEDPTFDATAVATNPRARMRPYHRPPRAADHSGPVCAWRVYIDPDGEPLAEHPMLSVVQATQLASIAIESPDAAVEEGGMTDYSGPLLGNLQLERFSYSALVAIVQELAVQNNLLARAMAMVVDATYGADAASDVGEFQMVGSAHVVAQRLARLLGYRDGGIEAVASVLAIHPAFQPLTYSQLDIETLDECTLLMSLGDGPARSEPDAYGWIKLLDEGRDAGLQSLVQGIDPSARCERDTRKDACWRITVGKAGDINAEPEFAVQIAASAIAANFSFKDEPELLRFME